MSDDLPPLALTEGFWQRTATKSALISTIGLGLMVLRSYVVGEPISREALSVAIEATVWTWAGAWGLHYAGPASRRA